MWHIRLHDISTAQCRGCDWLFGAYQDVLLARYCMCIRALNAMTSKTVGGGLHRLWPGPCGGGHTPRVNSVQSRKELSLPSRTDPAWLLEEL